MAGGQCGDETHLSRLGHHRRADRTQHPLGAQVRAAGDVFVDILYDTLHKYDPDHLMLRITREEAMRGLVDFGRIEEMIARVERPDRSLQLSRVTPLAAPLFLEMGRVPVKGDAEERLLAEEAARLMETSGLAQLTPPPSDKPKWRVGW